MNTNSKHYEELNIQPWEIMEANFNKEEFIAYLKGNIIKYTLRSKGQDLSDAEKIKHYAEKLIEVQKGRPVLVAEKPEEVAEAPLVESEKTYTYNIGDRVLVKSKIERTRMKGTVIRTPVDDEAVFCNDNYIIELDSAYNGWKATLDHELVRSDNAWYADDSELELLEEAPKKTLKPNKWYDASTYTVEELKELLPEGTKVFVTVAHDNDRTVELEKEELKEDKVNTVTKRPFTRDTRIELSKDCWFRRYFKIVEE